MATALTGEGRFLLHVATPGHHCPNGIIDPTTQPLPRKNVISCSKQDMRIGSFKYLYNYTATTSSLQLTTHRQSSRNKKNPPPFIGCGVRVSWASSSLHDEREASAVFRTARFTTLTAERRHPRPKQPLSHTTRHIAIRSPF